MEALLVYFFKINIVISILFLVYWAFFKKEKFFLLNRVVLLGILVISFLLPLIPVETTTNSDYTILKGLHQQVSRLPLVETMEVKEKSDNRGKERERGEKNVAGSMYDEYSLLKLGLFAYILIAFILVVRFTVQLIHLSHLLQGNEKKVIDGVVYHNSTKPVPPFSFFHHLVINRSHHKAEEIEQIILHEKVHIKQWHMVDILLSEVVQILLWINPFVWILNKYLKLNLEFIADEKVLHTGIDRKQYQMTILTNCLNPTEYQLANLFTSSTIKLRIHMMNSKNTPLRNIYKYACILPVLLLVYFVINPVSAQTASAVKSDQATNVVPVSFEGAYVVINNQTQRRSIEDMVGTLKKYSIDFKIKNPTFNSRGFLVSIEEVEVSVADVYNGSLSIAKGNQPLSKTIIFYYEPGNGAVLTDAGIPQELSARGKLVVSNNLNGAMILINNDNTILNGTGYTNWK